MADDFGIGDIVEYTAHWRESPRGRMKKRTIRGTIVEENPSIAPGAKFGIREHTDASGSQGLLYPIDVKLRKIGRR
jgi:hypothetical protein